jgi:hypothetical protein
MMTKYMWILLVRTVDLIGKNDEERALSLAFSHILISSFRTQVATLHTVYPVQLYIVYYTTTRG